MDSDLIELVSIARALRVAALAAPQDWPPGARAICGLCLDLSVNAEAVLSLVTAQAALIERLESRVNGLVPVVGKIRAEWSTESEN